MAVPMNWKAIYLKSLVSSPCKFFISWKAAIKNNGGGRAENLNESLKNRLKV